jgi:diaminohydroxyphosphoribosylaminopyrimidine deaminase/5-amino-6-(5-phosphoribosylamino)uracil reductase
MFSDEMYMERCMELAANGLGKVAPNPMVGAVLVHEDRIIGEGYHQKFGGPHAEVNCFNNIAENDKKFIPESTLYVSLEPCSHYGKTPPCADRIIQEKVKRVVVGSGDPNPLVAGNGIRKLKAAGIEVTEDVLKEKCDELNKRFNIYFKEKRPYVILKFAESSDEFIAPETNTQAWLSNALSKQLVHKWRAGEQAVLVGYNTALADNPQLNVREWEGSNPVRIVMDREATLPKDLQLFDGQSKTLVFTQNTAGSFPYAEAIQVNYNKDIVQQILNALFIRQIQSVIIEGGPATLQLFINANIWDETRIISTNKVLGNGKKVMLQRSNPVESFKLKEDIVSIYRNM